MGGLNDKTQVRSDTVQRNKVAIGMERIKRMVLSANPSLGCIHGKQLYGNCPQCAEYVERVINGTK